MLRRKLQLQNCLVVQFMNLEKATRHKKVSSRRRKAIRETEAMTSPGSTFHSLAAATRNARSPTVMSRVGRTRKASVADERRRRRDGISASLCGIWLCVGQGVYAIIKLCIILNCLMIRLMFNNFSSIYVILESLSCNCSCLVLLCWWGEQAVSYMGRSFRWPCVSAQSGWYKSILS